MCAMTMERALENAILAELAGARFYEGLAGLTSDEEAKGFFLEMAAEEIDHARHLRQKALTPGAGLELQRVLPERPPASRPPEEGLLEEINLLDAIDVAIEAEQDAMMTYTLLAGQTSRSVSVLFMEIAQTEERHMNILQSLQARLLQQP